MTTVQMTTTEARPGDKAPAITVKGWKYTEEWFPAGQHTPGSYPGQRADVLARHTGTFALDLDLYKDGATEKWEPSATRAWIGDRLPYIKRGDEGSLKYLIIVSPEIAAEWWPVAGGLGWGEIRSAGIIPSAGSLHPAGDTYDAVPGPDPVRYPDGQVIMTNVIWLDQAGIEALTRDGAKNKLDLDLVPGDAGLPADDGHCPLVISWLDKNGGPGYFAGATPRGERANAAVCYLKALAAEGHKVGRWVDEVSAMLPETSEADFAGMWATAPVPADAVKIARDCCTPAPFAASLNGSATSATLPAGDGQAYAGEDDEDAAGPGMITRLDQLRAGLMDWDELSKVPLPEPVIRSWLFRNTLAWIKGEPGGGKTLAAIDMAGCVSTGRPWHGHPVEKGPVLYLVLEGAQSIRQRAESWAALNETRPEGKTFCPVRVNLMDPADAYAVAQLAHEMQPALIVVDTQARATPGAEENSSKDMGTFVYHLEGIREACEACVLVVHHEPRSGQNLRGSTALEGAASTIIDASRDGLTVTLRTDAGHGGRQKDAPENKPFALTMVPAGPGMALDLTSDPGVLGEISQHALTILAQLAKAAGKLTTKQLGELTEIPRTSLQRELYDLRDKGRVVQGQHGITHTWRLPEPNSTTVDQGNALPAQNGLGRSAQTDPGSPGVPKPAQAENTEKSQVSEEPAQPAQPAQNQPKPARPATTPIGVGRAVGTGQIDLETPPAAGLSAGRQALICRLTHGEDGPHDSRCGGQ